MKAQINVDLMHMMLCTMRCDQSRWKRTEVLGQMLNPDYTKEIATTRLTDETCCPFILN